MADIHILQGRDGKLTAAYHVATPVGNNSIGISWITALLNSGEIRPSVLKDGDGTAGTIDGTEKAALAAGTLIEVLDEVLPDSVTTGPERLAYVRNRYALRTAERLAELAARLKWFGFVTTKA